MSTEELKCPECGEVPLKNESGRRNLTICGPVLKGGTSAKRGRDFKGVERYVVKATRRAWCRKGDAGALGMGHTCTPHTHSHSHSHLCPHPHAGAGRMVGCHADWEEALAADGVWLYGLGEVVGKENRAGEAAAGEAGEAAAGGAVAEAEAEAKGAVEPRPTPVMAEPTLDGITSFLTEYLRTVDLTTCTVRVVQAVLTTEMGAEAGRHYEKEWLKTETDRLVRERLRDEATAAGATMDLVRRGRKAEPIHTHTHAYPCMPIHTHACLFTCMPILMHSCTGG